MFCECYFLWPPYAPAQVNGGSRNFYKWWTLRVNRDEVTTWIFSWSSLNYRVGQKVTKFGIFSDPARKLFASRPNTAEYCNSKEKLVQHRWLLYTCATFGELWPNWDISTKFGLLIGFDLLKAATSANTKPEVVFSGRGRHLEKWILRHISAVGAPIWTKFGSLMQNYMQITANWSRSKPEVVVFQPPIEICRRNLVCW